jgi:hypothetical protein
MNLRQNSLDDLHNRMSWWACFRQEKSFTSPDFVEPSVPVRKPKKKVGKSFEEKESLVN